MAGRALWGSRNPGEADGSGEIIDEGERQGLYHTCNMLLSVLDTQHWLDPNGCFLLSPLLMKMLAWAADRAGAVHTCFLLYSCREGRRWGAAVLSLCSEERYSGMQ